MTDQTPREDMILATDLSKSFGSHTVLRDIDLEVRRGEVVAIIGPSGSGKSTLLRCLNLLEKPDGGTITIDGVSVTAPSISRKEAASLRNKTAMVFQQYHLFRNKRAVDNVAEPLVLGKKMPKAEARKLALETLERVGITGDTVDQYPVTLSGGQQQRVSIARALAIRPQAILFDEPTSALDPELVHEVLAVIRQLAEEHVTMVIVTHEMAFAAEVADRVVFIDGGVIVEQGPAREVITAPREERTQRFLRELASEPAQRERPAEPEPTALHVEVPLS